MAKFSFTEYKQTLKLTVKQFIPNMKETSWITQFANNKFGKKIPIYTDTGFPTVFNSKWNILNNRNRQDIYKQENDSNICICN